MSNMKRLSGTSSQLSVARKVGNRSRSSVVSTKNGDVGSVLEEDAVPVPQTTVFRFFYSQAVERAMRRIYACPAFGPLSSKVPTDPFVEVPDLNQLYADFLFVRHKQLSLEEKRLLREQAELRRDNSRATLHSKRSKRQRTLSLPRIESRSDTIASPAGQRHERQDSRLSSQMTKLPPITKIN